METQKMIKDYGIRGACCCGSCVDAPDTPQEHQPEGVNLTFFRVGVRGGLTAEEFKKTVEAEFPHFFNGQEHSYLQVGGDIGDQGMALTLIGMGHQLGVWKALSPDTLLPSLPEAIKKQMAGSGMVALQVTR